MNTLIILASALIGCILIFAFGSLLRIPIGVTRSKIRLNIFPIAAEIKKYKSIIKKKKKEHDKIVLIAKSKFIRKKVLISKTLIS